MRVYICVTLALVLLTKHKELKESTDAHIISLLQRSKPVNVEGRGLSNSPLFYSHITSLLMLLARPSTFFISLLPFSLHLRRPPPLLPAPTFTYYSDDDRIQPWRDRERPIVE